MQKKKIKKSTFLCENVRSVHIREKYIYHSWRGKAKCRQLRLALTCRLLLTAFRCLKSETLPQHCHWYKQPASFVYNISLIVAPDIKGKRRPKFPEKIMEPEGKAYLKHVCLYCKCERDTVPGQGCLLSTKIPAFERVGVTWL
jgi:hypothetical protein